MSKPRCEEGLYWDCDEAVAVVWNWDFGSLCELSDTQTAWMGWRILTIISTESDSRCRTHQGANHRQPLAEEAVDHECRILTAALKSLLPGHMMRLLSNNIGAWRFGWLDDINDICYVIIDGKAINVSLNLPRKESFAWQDTIFIWKKGKGHLHSN